jgi:hypothetical protein
MYLIYLSLVLIGGRPHLHLLLNITGQHHDRETIYVATKEGETQQQVDRWLEEQERDGEDVDVLCHRALAGPGRDGRLALPPSDPTQPSAAPDPDGTAVSLSLPPIQRSPAPRRTRTGRPSSSPSLQRSAPQQITCVIVITLPTMTGWGFNDSR